MRFNLTEALINAWQISNQVSIGLVGNISTQLWNEKIPGYPRKTIGMVAIHIHNARCMWIKAIQKESNGNTPKPIYPNPVSPRKLVAAMRQSNKAMLRLINACFSNDGRLPSRPAWQNFPNDVVHLISYFVAHEAHHRGQITMAARQLGQPLRREVSGELWQWSKLSKMLK